MLHGCDGIPQFCHLGIVLLCLSVFGLLLKLDEFLVMLLLHGVHLSAQALNLSTLFGILEFESLRLQTLPLFLMLLLHGPD